MGIIIVEICDSNLLSSADLEGLLSEYPEVTVMRYECLNRCSLCKMRPYALVNGNQIYAASISECIPLIKEAIEEELSFFL
ncbi:DUF1450 domain-containing protein [Bacillus sp. 1P06AnD]|uniref:DUF1450 domain-containing protein n=1 Tax=Bacillus sp. 1P06AnD TaxID=3132208 RepID=UPI0039A22141